MGFRVSKFIYTLKYSPFPFNSFIELQFICHTIQPSEFSNSMLLTISGFRQFSPELILGLFCQPTQELSTHSESSYFSRISISPSSSKKQNKTNDCVDFSLFQIFLTNGMRYYVVFFLTKFTYHVSKCLSFFSHFFIKLWEKVFIWTHDSIIVQKSRQGLQTLHPH